MLVISPTKETFEIRALLDQGSEISLISERIVQQLRLPRNHSSISLVGIGAQHSNKTKGVTTIKLRDRFNKFDFSIQAHILRKLTTSIPSTQINKPIWPHLKGLQLADPNFLSPRSIDLILGADIYGHIIENKVIKGPPHSPTAQFTKLGWIVSGPTDTNVSSNTSHSYHVSVDDELYRLLHRFWEIDEIPSVNTSSLSSADQECENHFVSTHSRDAHGRYIVKLPFKRSPDQLGNSRNNAVRLSTNLSNKFSTNSVYAQLYSKFMSEYESLEHMQIVPESQPEPQPVYYLPHHGVMREHSLTTKLRVVFNGSSRTTSGVSLNDLLHTGAKLQTNLFDVLVWFSKFHCVFVSDMEKMYRQIKVHPEDWKFQRILWFNQSNCLRTYELTTVTYGLACAPFLALRTLLQLIEDEGQNFPRAIPSLTKGRYVDDVFGGADSIDEVQPIITQLNQLCMAGGFTLRKWISNYPSILKDIPTEHQTNLTSLEFKDSTVFNALGLCWQPAIDAFQFTLKLPSTKHITKRSILSTISTLFDPLGLLSPITIKAKILIQELWAIKLDWDDHLPMMVTNKWTTFLNTLQEMTHLTFPRWLGCKSTDKIEIHGFCDASQQAAAAAVYLRSTDSNGIISINLVASKTKVAPLKKLTIPRLELSGAVLLAKLSSHILKVLEIGNIPIYLWTDSAITYTWINNHPSRWKEFVHNRVCYIQETLPSARWKFVPGNENPADLATRGLTPIQLSEHPTWWTGPPWLSQNSSKWPQPPKALSVNENLEERPVKIFTTNLTPPPLWDLVHKYSTVMKLFRITAICQRVLARMRKHPQSSLTIPLTTQEIDNARFFWIKHIQNSSFGQEKRLLSSGQSLPKSHSLARLTPFLDATGLLRIGGRLQASLLPPNAKHPLILPRKSPLTSLIILDSHLRTMHGGTQLTLNYIRNNYWIVGGRAPIRSFILKCVKCTRYRQSRAQQLMGQLPSERITPSRPFLHSGVDYAGPFTIKTWKGKNAKTYKAYMVLFVCFSTSAIHLELVTDYTTEAFIGAYKRFTSRRGICATLTSDCGTNFTGADCELKRLFSSSTKELGELASVLANDGTQWKFHPPAAPHFGGKWEAGVKSVKYHLKRVVGDTLLTFEEMNTLLTQIEAVLNSRPLSPLTDDPDDLQALTPGHFLVGNAPSVIPEPSLETVKSSRLSRWQLTRQMLDSFWSRWSRECLQRYYSIHKWNQPSPSLSNGSLVLVIDERYPPSKWPLGRIIQTHPGPDGLVRVVSIRTQKSILKRPIAKLCPLPINNDSL